MADVDLRKLNRVELLEMLIKLAEENEKLRGSLAQAQRMLESRVLAINNAGSIAEASLRLNGVFEAAQAAADQYLENVRDTEAVCRRMLEEARAKADKIVSDAEAQAAMIEADTKSKADVYWQDVSKRLEDFFAEHQALRELLKINSGK